MKRWIPLAVTALALTACNEGSGGSGSGVTPPVVAAPPLGGPIAGLTPLELAAFERGKVIFERRFAPSEGLGPFYNATSCASCHSTPVTGGSARLYRNFYLAVYGNPPQQQALPPFLSPVVPAFGSGDAHSIASFTLEGGRPAIPSDYFGIPVTVTQRNAVPIFGTGLFEFVSNATIIGLADPEDLDGDGISGRFNTDSGAIGRFGVKAQSNNIELFTRAPLQNQMGVTSNPFLGTGGTVSLGVPAAVQVSSDPNQPTSDNDGVPDPEISHDDLGDLIAFSRFLAPPTKRPFNDAARRGETLFEQLGCVKCHVPTLPSSRGPVHAYSDLLLHEMGQGLADFISFGIPQPASNSPLGTELEFRTQPLWGVSLHAPFLHDGRAETLAEAIVMHGGEAASIRAAFQALSPTEQGDVIAFLEHL